MTIRSRATTCSCFLLLLFVVLFPSCKRTTTQFISVKDPVIALQHVRVIDGTGVPALEDQTIVIDSGRIAAIGPTAEISIPASAKSLDLSGHTAMPGLVGMHNHLFYAIGDEQFVFATDTFAPLYLASGVTTIRTAGALKLSLDQEVKKAVDAGELAGPKIHLSSPYINKDDDRPIDPQKVTVVINEWADQGVTSLKVYDKISRSDLQAITNAAHARGIKVTGHLCAVGFVDAARIGIDNLEHGLAVDTEFFSGKKPEVCPRQNQYFPELARIDVKSEPVQKMIRELVNYRVAVTSTLAIFEAFVDEKFQLDPRMQDILSEDVYAALDQRLIARPKTCAGPKSGSLCLRKRWSLSASL